jgi:NAD(P)H-nitrite reductase large subunit
VLFAQSRSAMIKRVLRSPLVALRHSPALLAAAAAFARLKRAGVPVRFERTIRRIDGETQVAGAVTAAIVGGAITPHDHDEDRIACDRVALCFGFVPQADLPRAAGARMRRIDINGGWATVADRWMRSSLPGLYVAGETTGVGGAGIALAEGYIAGLAIAMDAGRIAADAAEAAVAATRARLDRLGRFARLLDDIAAPGTLLSQLPDAETILCRCEDVRFGAVAAALDAAGAPEGVSAIKLVTRAGMGLCQGRSCEHAVARLAAARGKRSTGAGFTPRFPVRPVAIADLID